MNFRLLQIMCCLLLLAVTPQLSFAQFHKIDSLEALLARKTDTVKVNIMIALADNYYNVNVDKAFQIGQQANELAKKLNFLNGQYEALRLLSSLHAQKGELKNALAVNKECVAIAKKTGDKRKLANARGFLGMSYRYLNYHSKAFEELTAAVELFRELGDTENEASFSLSIGNIYLNLKDFESAKRYYQKAISLSQSDTNLKHVVLINMGEILQEEKKHNEAMEMLDKALQYFESNGRQTYVAYIQFLKAKGYYAQGDKEKAKSFFNRAFVLYENMQNITGRSRCLVQLGNIALEERLYQKAVQYFESALALVKDQRKYSHLEQVYTGLVAGYKALGESEKSLENQIMVTLCKDSLNAISQREKLTELQVRYETDLAEKEILRLKADQKDYFVIIGLLVLLVIATIIIVTLVVRKHHTTIKQSEATTSKLHTELREKEEIAMNLQNELEFKVKELTSFTLNMIQKKEMLETVKSGIEEVRACIEGDARAKLSKILSTINFSQRQDKDWDNFKLYFEQVHQGFFDNLHAIYPDLNSNDLRLCALLRLNLDTKQIASVMDIAPESAKVAKHRIRKKLGLSNTDNLHLFFSSIASGKPYSAASASASSQAAVVKE